MTKPPPWPAFERFGWGLDYFDSIARDIHSPALRNLQELGAESLLSEAQLSVRSNQLARSASGPEQQRALTSLDLSSLSNVGAKAAPVAQGHHGLAELHHHLLGLGHLAQRAGRHTIGSLGPTTSRFDHRGLFAPRGSGGAHMLVLAARHLHCVTQSFNT